MPENNNIKKYSAIDIQRYHKGELSPEEMHAMEKAALDDPFLADAMEGFKQGMATDADLAFLQDKLKQRIAGGKVAELKSTQGSGWWKVAASIIFLIGAGVLVYQFVINRESDVVVKIPETKQKNAVITPTRADTSNSTNAADNTDVAKNDKVLKNQKANEKNLVESKQSEVGQAESDTVKNISTALASPLSTSDNKDTILYEAGRDLAREGNATSPALQKSKKVEEETRSFGAVKSSEKIGQASVVQTNVFRGQVLDANYNALPFANITSTQDKVGTYADAKGHFILTSSDSILNVQIRSVGFENSNASLRNDLPKNQVILQEDTKNLNEIVINNKKTNSSRKKMGNTKVEEPEPEDGWENYDTYIVNNLNIPDEIQLKSSGNGEVEMTFNVNKNGKPENIKIEKSLCKECDREAIRLLKEGPKWKSRGKKSRARVTVPF